MFSKLVENTPWPQQAGSRTALGPFSGCADARCIAELAVPGRLLVVITAQTSSALALERELPFFLDDPCEILILPDWETLPYDNFSPHQDIISERLNTLYRLPGLTSGILIVPMPTLMHRLCPTDYIAGSSLVLQAGQTLNVESFRTNLQRNGYVNVETVYEHGEFALRGSLLDVYPMGSELPYRIDLLDDQVDSLRTFDPETQRTVDKVNAINLLPAREYPLEKAAVRRFQMNWYDSFDVDHDLCPTYVDVSAGRSPGGCEYYLPLFFDECATLFDYLPDNSALITTGDHYAAAQHFWDEANTRFDEYGIDPRRPLLPPKRCFVRGAFTGADRAKMGRFEAASRGTLLLDEIDVLSPKEQVKLLRVLETGQFEPVGSIETRTSQARLIVASNVDLQDLVASGEFRSDLYYRLNVLQFHLPPLKQRVLDIVPFAMQFVNDCCREQNVQIRTVSRDFLKALKDYHWPGNLRELKNQIQRAVLFSTEARLTRSDLNSTVLDGGASPNVRRLPAESSLADRVALTEQQILLQALRENDFNRTATARKLGLSRVGLYKKLRKHDLMERRS